MELLDTDSVNKQTPYLPNIIIENRSTETHETTRALSPPEVEMEEVTNHVETIDGHMIDTTNDPGGPSPLPIPTLSAISQSRPLASDYSLSIEHAKLIQLFEDGLLQDTEIDILLNTDDIIEPLDTEFVNERAHYLPKNVIENLNPETHETAMAPFPPEKGMEEITNHDETVTEEESENPPKTRDLKFFFNNIVNNKDRVHTLLAESKYDVLCLVDTPWYQIGADRLLNNESGHAVFRTVNNSEYQYFHPTGKLTEKAFIAVYVKKWLLRQMTITHRIDLINDTCAIAINIDESIIVCAYNKPNQNSRVMEKIYRMKTDEGPLIIVGDFNLHHPDWDNKYVGTTPTPAARAMADWVEDSNLVILNDPTQLTFFSHKC